MCCKTWLLWTRRWKSHNAGFRIGVRRHRLLQRDATRRYAEKDGREAWSSRRRVMERHTTGTRTEKIGGQIVGPARRDADPGSDMRRPRFNSAADLTCREATAAARLPG